MKRPFNPQFLPIEIDDKDLIEILKLEVEARAKVEKFNSILERSVIKRELLMLFSFNESIQSTRIEGTQTSFSQVMEAESTGNRNKDTTEVMNYFEALNNAEILLRQIPISTRMFLKLHEIILRNPNYIPPEPQKVNMYMENLEKYINNMYEDDFGFLARTAIIHGQFETIHPFLDGNGRLGRILIIIYLLDKGVISHPSFFVSEELEKNKFKYYALLNGLRLEEPRWKEWIIFFLESAIKQADKYTEKLINIEDLYNELVELAKDRSINIEAILFIFNKPIFTIRDMQRSLGVSYNTASRYTDILVEDGKIYGDDKKRNRIFRFYDLLDRL